jgi:hypothetical protein
MERVSDIYLKDARELEQFNLIILLTVVNY